MSVDQEALAKPGCYQHRPHSLPARLSFSFWSRWAVAIVAIFQTARQARFDWGKAHHADAEASPYIHCCGEPDEIYLA